MSGDTPTIQKNQNCKVSKVRESMYVMLLMTMLLCSAEVLLLSHPHHALLAKFRNHPDNLELPNKLASCLYVYHSINIICVESSPVTYTLPVCEKPQSMYTVYLILVISQHASRTSVYKWVLHWFQQTS